MAGQTCMVTRLKACLSLKFFTGLGLGRYRKGSAIFFFLRKRPRPRDTEIWAGGWRRGRARVGHDEQSSREGARGNAETGQNVVGGGGNSGYTRGRQRIRQRQQN